MEDIKNTPNDAGAHNKLGVELYEQERYIEAEKQFRMAIKLDPYIAAYHENLGTALVYQGRRCEAIAHYMKAVEIAPDDADIHNKLGLAMYLQERYGEAEVQFRIAAEIDPNNATYLDNLSKAARNAKKASGNNMQSENQKQQQLDQTIDEKAFSKFVKLYALRNYFIVSCGAAILILLILIYSMSETGQTLMTVVLILLIYESIPVGFAIHFANQLSKKTKRISFAKSNGTYGEVLREFAASTSVLDGKIRCSENYIFGSGSVCFLNYKNIEWIYVRRETTYNRYGLYMREKNMIKVGDITGEVETLCGLAKNTETAENEAETVMRLVCTKNAAVMLGYNEENEKMFKEKTKKMG